MGNNYNSNFNGNYNNCFNNNSNNESNPNELSKEKAIKGYLTILVIAVVIIAFYFLTKPDKKNEESEVDSNVITEQNSNVSNSNSNINNDQGQNISSNYNASVNSNSNVTQKSNSNTSSTGGISKLEFSSFYQDVELYIGTDTDIKDILDVTPTNADLSKLTYSSSNTSVATVSNNGIVKTISGGKTTITVTAPNGVKAS